MYRVGRYYVIEKPEDFLDKWDDSWKRFDKAISPISPDDLKVMKYPFVLYYCDSYAPNCCGHYCLINNKEDLDDFKTYLEDTITSFNRQIEIIKQIQNKI